MLSKDSLFPPEFFDPITLELMTDPVIAMDGMSYERKSIERWFAEHDTSPITGGRIRDKILIPNFNLKSQMIAFKENLEREANSDS